MFDFIAEYMEILRSEGYYGIILQVHFDGRKFIVKMIDRKDGNEVLMDYAGEKFLIVEADTIASGMSKLNDIIGRSK